MITLAAARQTPRNLPRYDDTPGVLEFVSDLDGIDLNRIHMIEWSDADEITMFEAPQTVVAKMAELPQAPVKG